MTERVLVAGVTGQIGGSIARRVSEKGCKVRGLSRGAAPRLGPIDAIDDYVACDLLDDVDLSEALSDVDTVVSTVGASLALTFRGRKSFEDVDVPANRRLLQAAEEAGVDRMLYVSVHADHGYDHTRYVKAHLEVEELLEESPISSTVVAPTGVFGAFTQMVDLARRGSVPVFEGGGATTNPVHPADVADAVADYLQEGPAHVSVGGPDVFTRKEIAELACEVVGREPDIRDVSARPLRAVMPFARWLHPRVVDLFDFVVCVSTSDSVAPKYGERRLEAFLKAYAAATT